MRPSAATRRAPFGLEHALDDGDSADALAQEATSGVEARVGRWSSPAGRLLRTVLAIGLFLLVAGLVWEGFKWLFGRPVASDVRASATSTSRRSTCMQATDLQLPHLWNIASALIEPVQRNQQRVAGQYPPGARRSTPGARPLIGFAIGALIGIVLAAIFVHSVLAERAFVPYVIASQTIPIVALAPLIVVGFGRGLDVGRHHRRRTSRSSR